MLEPRIDNRRRPQVVVRHHSAWRIPVVVAMLLLLVGVGFALYILGGRQVELESLQSAQLQQQQEGELEELRQALQTLSSRNALLERSSQVDGKAYAQVREELQMLQAEILALREEVTFYRGIVAPGEGDKGLRVERLELTQGGDEPLYHYRLMLTQVVKKSRLVRGAVTLRLVGVEGGKPKSFTLEKLMLDAGGKHSFNFRYFQEFEGDFKLPEKFTPRSLEVEVKPTTKGSKAVSRRFEWAELEKGEAS